MAFLEQKLQILNILRISINNESFDIFYDEMFTEFDADETH